MSPIRTFGFCLFFAGLFACLFYGYKNLTVGETIYEIPIDIDSETSNPDLINYALRNIRNFDKLQYVSTTSPSFSLDPSMNPIKMTLVISKRAGTTTGVHNNKIERSLFSLTDQNQNMIWATEGAIHAGRRTEVGLNKKETFNIYRFNMDRATDVQLSMNLNKKLLSGISNEVSVKVRANVVLADSRLLLFGIPILIIGTIILAVTYKNPNALRKRNLRNDG